MFNRGKNAVIAAIAGTQDYAVRYLYLPNRKGQNGKRGVLTHAVYDEDTAFTVEGSAEVTALQVAARTLNQYADAMDAGDWKGTVALILPKGAAIRTHSIRGKVKSGLDGEAIAEEIAAKVSAYFEMSDEHMQAISDYAEALIRFQDADKLSSVREYDAFNLKYWRLDFDPEETELAEGQEIELVKQDNDLATEDGSIVLETNGDSYVGKHKVVLVQDGVNSNGEPKMAYAIERTNDGTRLANINKVWDKVLNLFGEEDDIDELIDIDENAIEEVEEDTDLDELEDVEMAG